MHRTHEILDGLSLIPSARISNQWTNERRKHILVYPPFNLCRALLSIDVYTQTVLYASLIKGWSSSRIAQHLDVAVITIQELLQNGRKQLTGRLADLGDTATADEQQLPMRTARSLP